MPFTRPTLAQLIERAAMDVESRLPGVDARTRRSNLAVLGRVHAGAVHGLYGYLDFLSKQLIIDSAEQEHLERWASVWGVARAAAAQAKGSVTLIGTNGIVAPAGTELSRSDGVVFTLDADATIASGTATAAVTAKDGGATGNTAASTSLSFVTPIAGINSAGTVAAGGLTGGTDAESDEALRARLLDRIQEPPHGGSSLDYVKWAKEVPGVTRAWAYPLEGGAGTVTVRFMTDDLTADGIPSAGKVAEVQAYINERKPVTANVTVAAPTAVALNFTIAVVPNTAAVQAAVEAELKDLIRREAEPGGTIYISHIRESISIAAGEVNYTLTTPTADVTRTTGQITTMGAITWS